MSAPNPTPLQAHAPPAGAAPTPPVEPLALASTPARAVWLVVLLGVLLGGLGEFLLRVAAFVRPGLFGTRIALNPQAIWLAPLANLLLAAPLVVLLLLVGRRWPARRLIYAATVLAFFLALFEPMLITQRIHIVAQLVLAAGIAAEVARRGVAHPRAFARIVRASVATLLLLVATLGVGWNVARATFEWRALRTLPAARDGAPNVLFLVLDTVRAMELSAYGFPLPTSPSLAALASRGVRFDHAIATTSWTLPSHASMFTGRYPSELSASWTLPLDDADPTLAERLRANGYRTGGFVANLAYCSYQFGLDRGFIRYEDYTVTPSEMIGATMLGQRLVSVINEARGSYFEPGRKSAERINRDLLQWIGRDDDRPFFAFVNYFDAHAPYAPPAPPDARFSARPPTIRDIPYGRRHTPEEVAALRAAYDESIAYLDGQIGALMNELERRGVLANTIVVVVADHGEEFQEHENLNHGNSLYLPNVHVPLLVSYPARIPAGQRVATPVTLRDLPATLLDLTGLADRERLPGHSLAPLWDAARASESHASPSPLLSELESPGRLPAWYPISKGTGSMKSIVVDRHHFIRRGDGHEELYDIVSDPLEQHDLARDTSSAALVDRMRAALGAAIPSPAPRD